MPRALEKVSSLPEGRDSIGRFIDAYNEVDAHMRRQLGLGGGPGFLSVLNQYIEKHGRIPELRELKLFAELRNVAVHMQSLVNPAFVPSDKAVERLEQIRDRLLSPPLAGSAFRRKVVTVAQSDSLAGVLDLVRQNDFSQFPVYDGPALIGLLTENGITRWLAQHVNSSGSLVELVDHSVAEVLKDDRKSLNFKVVGREVPVDVVQDLFADHANLEAVIVTNSGKPSETPLGIATQWDVARLQGGS